jgi:hypothetical protein
VSSDKDKSSVFKVKNVNVKVDSLKFSVRDSKHDFLYKVVKPLATGLVKRQIQKALAGAITTGFEYVDGQLAEVRHRLAEAKLKEGESRMQVLQEVRGLVVCDPAEFAMPNTSSSPKIFSRKKEEAASVKTSEKGSQFKVVADKRQSLLANQGHPAGWVNRTAEREEKVGQGYEWRSEAYVFLFLVFWQACFFLIMLDRFTIV